MLSETHARRLFALARTGSDHWPNRPAQQSARVQHHTAHSAQRTQRPTHTAVMTDLIAHLDQHVAAADSAIDRAIDRYTDAVCQAAAAHIAGELADATDIWCSGTLSDDTGETILQISKVRAGDVIFDASDLGDLEVAVGTLDRWLGRLAALTGDTYLGDHHIDVATGALDSDADMP